MKVKLKEEFEAIQFKKDNYEEFKTMMENRFWSLSPLHKTTNQYWCYISDTMEPIYIHDGDYVIFKEYCIVDVLNEESYNEKYEAVE